MMTNTNTGNEIRNLLSAYAVYGGDWMVGYGKTAPEIIALSVTYLRQTKSAAYRIATLADGGRALAVRYSRKGATWQVVFSADRLGVAA